MIRKTAENQMQPIRTLWGQNSKLLDVKKGGTHS